MKPRISRAAEVSSSLQTAKSPFIVDRMDWNKPDPSWIPDRFYRPFRQVRARA